MTITQYLGMGTVSRGRLDITPQLNTRVITPPYLRNASDKEAVIQGIEYMRGVLSQIANLTWIVPSATQNTTAFVNSVSCVSFNLMLLLSTNLANYRFPPRRDPETRTIGRAPARLARTMDARAVTLLLI